jgi:fumarate reductase subunit D
MSEQTHWLYRKQNRSKLWLAQFVILALALLPGLFIHHHAHFPGTDFRLDASVGFYAWYGFATCGAMVILAKVLGIFLKRPDDYYDD